MTAEVPPTQAPPPLDPSEVKAALDAIDFEISEVRGAHRGSGWTSWGVLAAVAWLMADVLKTEIVSERVVLRLFFLGSISVDLVVGLATLFGIQYPLFPVREDRRLPMGWGVPLNGLEVVYALGRGAICVWIAAFEWPDVSQAMRVVAYAYCTMGLPMILLALTMRVIAFPTRVGVSRSMVRIQVLIAFLILLLPLGILLKYAAVYVRGTNATLAEYQLAGLLVAAALLLGRLARLYRHAPTLVPLIGVRRDLVFSRIRPEEALRRLESTIVGKTAADLVAEAMEPLSAESRAYKRAMRTADVLAAKYRAEGGGLGVVPDAEVNNWWKRDVRRWGREQKRLGWYLKWLMFRLRFLTAGDPAADEVATKELKRLAEDGFGRGSLFIALMDRRLALLGKTRPTESAPPDKNSP